MFLLLGFSTTCICSGGDGSFSSLTPAPITSPSGLPQVPQAFWHHMGYTILFSDSWFTPRPGYTPETRGILIRFPNIFNRPPSTSSQVSCMFSGNEMEKSLLKMHFITWQRLNTSLGVGWTLKCLRTRTAWSLAFSEQSRDRQRPSPTWDLNCTKCIMSLWRQRPRRDMTSYLLWGKAVHRWVWHGLQLVLTDTHTENNII